MQMGCNRILLQPYLYILRGYLIGEDIMSNKTVIMEITEVIELVEVLEVVDMLLEGRYSGELEGYIDEEIVKRELGLK